MSNSSSEDYDEAAQGSGDEDDNERSSDATDDFEKRPQDREPKRSAPKTDAKAKGKTSFSRNLLLRDGDANWFYTYDDPDMKRWLGQDTFKSLLRFHPNGFVDEHKGRDKGNLRLYKSSMMHVRHQTKCLYTEPEYEELAIEAHIASRPKTSDKSSKGRVPFTCVHCREKMKDKNRLSWHKITGECKAYTGECLPP